MKLYSKTFGNVLNHFCTNLKINPVNIKSHEKGINLLGQESFSSIDTSYQGITYMKPIFSATPILFDKESWFKNSSTIKDTKIYTKEKVENQNIGGPQINLKISGSVILVLVLGWYLYEHPEFFEKKKPS